MQQLLKDQRILITGGTGSLGKSLLMRILSNKYGKPAEITVFSRDEAKQFQLRNQLIREFQIHGSMASSCRQTDCVKFQIGDIRDYKALEKAVSGQEIVFHAAAMKQVPAAEYNPSEAIKTNLLGTENLINIATSAHSKVKKVIGISTDKACNPVNVMGMTKALQERMLIEANMREKAVFSCVRYGNVVASRGSAVPLFCQQISSGGPVTVTSNEMTRFLITLDMAVEAIMTVFEKAAPGEIWVPAIPAVKIGDLVRILISELTPHNGIPVEILETGIRPGEKIHELLVSLEEAPRTFFNNGYYIVESSFPELSNKSNRKNALTGPVSSNQHLATDAEIITILKDAAIL